MLVAGTMALVLLGTAGCGQARPPHLLWTASSSVPAATASQEQTGREQAGASGSSQGSSPKSSQEQQVRDALIGAVLSQPVPATVCAPVAAELLADQLAFGPTTGGTTVTAPTGSVAGQPAPTLSGIAAPTQSGQLPDYLDRRLLAQGLTTLALDCPTQASAAVFALARLGSPALPSTARLRAVAQKMGSSADGIALATDREYFVRRFLRLSRSGATMSEAASDAAAQQEESQAGTLSDVFARPAVLAGRKDPRQKIYSTAGLGQDSLSQKTTDPATGMQATRGQILLMDEARAAAAALPAMMTTSAPEQSRRDALTTAVWFARRAYAAGYPLSYPAL